MTERKLDLKYKNGVDTGAMSLHKVEMPFKAYSSIINQTATKTTVDKSTSDNKAVKRYKSDMKLINKKNRLKQ
jgi:hypothetical protein